MERLQLIRALKSYLTPYSEESNFIKPFLKLLESEGAFQRTNLPGHITGSVWIVNSTKQQALLVHHVNLKKWVQPGGHADGDENILRVALREAEEETGIKKFKITPSIFDIDIHTIPARNNFQEHFHYDIRFLIEADEHDPIIVSEESHDVKWIAMGDLEKYTTERSVLRMKEKIQSVKPKMH